MKQSDAGFTLLEVLVGLSVLALTLGLLGGSLQFGARTWERGQAVVDRNTEMRAAYRFLSRLVAETRPEVRRDDDGPAFAFVGAADGLAVNDLSLAAADGRLWASDGRHSSPPS